jgi:hypothetical protein
VHLQIIPNDEIGIVGNVTITDTATQKSNSYPFFGPGPGGDIFDEFVIPVGDKFLVNANVIGNGPNSLLTPDPASTIACNSTGPATCVATMINNNPHLILDVGTTD